MWIALRQCPNITAIDNHKATAGGSKMKHNAKVPGLLAVMMVLTLVLAGCQANPPAVVGSHLRR